jgi:hypothetical protein
MSNFMITPFGFIIILIYSVVIAAIALFLALLLKRLRWRWVLLAPPLVAMLALPWAEEAWISWHFTEACKDAGVTVYRTVEVSGYVNDTNPMSRFIAKPFWTVSAGAIGSFDAAGYSFVENKLTDGGVQRVERKPGGLKATVLDQPTARYHVKYTHQPYGNEVIGWKLVKHEKQVVDSQTGEVLGRDIRIGRIYPTYEALWVRLLGSPSTGCPSGEIERQQPRFPQAVLKPLLNHEGEQK